MSSIPLPPEVDEMDAARAARQKEVDEALLARHRAKLSLNDGPTDRDWAEKSWLNPPQPLSYAARLVDLLCFAIAGVIGLVVGVAALLARVP